MPGGDNTSAGESRKLSVRAARRGRSTSSAQKQGAGSDAERARREARLGTHRLAERGSRPPSLDAGAKTHGALAMHQAKCEELKYMKSLNPHNNPRKYVLLLFSKSQMRKQVQEGQVTF